MMDPVASIPFILGMLMSITTTSGLSRSVSFTASGCRRVQVTDLHRRGLFSECNEFFIQLIAHQGAIAIDVRLNGSAAPTDSYFR